MWIKVSIKRAEGTKGGRGMVQSGRIQLTVRNKEREGRERQKQEEKKTKETIRVVVSR